MQQDSAPTYSTSRPSLSQASFECVKRVESVRVAIPCGGSAPGASQQLAHAAGHELLYIIIVVGAVVVFFL